MKLFYKIEFNSTNLYYKNIIENLIADFQIEAKVKQYRNFILIICDDSEEKIEGFFKYLGDNLPLSIFLGKATTLDFFDESTPELSNDAPLQNISMFTNKEINKIVDENSHIDFSNDIKKIQAGKVSRIETHNGFKDLFLPSKEIREDFEKRGLEVKLLVCDLSKLQDLCSLNQKDLQILCSVERPLVKLKFTILNNQNKEFSKTDFINVKIPDDKETILFANALRKEGISYLLYAKEESLQEGIKVSYFDEKNIIISGDKSIFPKYDFTSEKRFNSSKEFFDEQGGVPKATIASLNKRIKPVIGVYFSKKSEDSSIFVNIPGRGFKEIISIPNIIYNLDNALEEIANIDENTQRLITNYKNKFPQFFEKPLSKSDANGFEAILDICARTIGLEDFDDFENAAHAYNSKSGMQIDMKLVKIDGDNYLDYRRVIQSIMSFKMADVDNRMLAYSFYESLCDFIKDNVQKINEDVKAADLILCGDFFANSIVISKTFKNLQNDFNILVPREYPLDY